MWRCSNCGTGIEDKYAHCWQCGAPNRVKPATQKPLAQKSAPQPAVPAFASYEELANVPARPPWILRRGPLQRIVILLSVIIIFKILAAPFLGKYGLYIVAVVGVVSLALILWRSFRRDASEGVGIKLN